MKKLIPKCLNNAGNAFGNLSKQLIKSMQINLMKAGFDVGSKGADGIMGKDTRKALNAAIAQGYIQLKDGSFKKVSKQNSKQNSKSNSNTTWEPERNTNGVCIPIIGPDGKISTECAYYANESLRRNGYRYDEAGNSAWNRGARGKNKLIFSGYDNTNNYGLYDYELAYLDNLNYRDKHGKYTQAMIDLDKLSDARNIAAADNLLKNFDSSTLDPNKVYVVNMYYRKSPNKAIAWREATGGTTGTHTGNLYYNDAEKRWKVAHNIHGTVMDDDWIKVQSYRDYRPTAIYEIPTALEAKDIDRLERRQAYKQNHPIKAAFKDLFGIEYKFGGKLKLIKV